MKKEFDPDFVDSDECNRTDDDAPVFDAELEVRDASVCDPPVGVQARYLEVARLHALGLTTGAIARRLLYSTSRVGKLLHMPFVRDEVARIRGQLVDKGALEVLKEASRDGVRLIHQTILDEDRDIRVRLDAAKWSKEQAYGKAHQSLTVENNTLNVYIDMMKEMKTRGDVIDVTPKSLPGEAEKAGRWEAWLDENIE